MLRCVSTVVLWETLWSTEALLENSYLWKARGSTQQSSFCLETPCFCSSSVGETVPAAQDGCIEQKSQASTAQEGLIEQEGQASAAQDRHKEQEDRAL